MTMNSIEQIRNRLIASGLADDKNIIGCTTRELNEIATSAKRDLPDDYLWFMEVFGRGAGKFLRDVTMFYPQVLCLRSIAQEIVLDYEEFNMCLPSSAFVFAVRYSEQFLFFEELGSNPKVKFYMSGEPEIEIVGDSFLDVIESELGQAETQYGSIKGTPYDF